MKKSTQMQQKFNLKFKVQSSNSIQNSKFKFKVQIQSSNSKFKFKVQIQSSNYLKLQEIWAAHIKLLTKLNKLKGSG